jgi:hypothetical protein
MEAAETGQIMNCPADLFALFLPARQRDVYTVCLSPRGVTMHVAGCWLLLQLASIPLTLLLLLLQLLVTKARSVGAEAAIIGRIQSAAAAAARPVPDL